MKQQLEVGPIRGEVLVGIGKGEEVMGVDI